jgi:hypothetical protein
MRIFSKKDLRIQIKYLSLHSVSGNSIDKIDTQEMGKPNETRATNEFIDILI